MPYVEANGLRFHVQRLGGGASTYVFVHGLAVDNMSSWFYTLANGVARRADVLLYDLRGHGLSERPRTGYSVPMMVADLDSVLDAVGITGPVHLVGNSFGGVIAIAYALAHPERTASLLLIEAHAAVEGYDIASPEELVLGLSLAGEFLDREEVQEWIERLGEARATRMGAGVEGLVLQTAILQELRDDPPISPDALRTIACPTLLVFGDASHIFERAQLLESLIPHAELHVVPGGNHLLLVQMPAEVRQHVEDWVTRFSG
jgi:pimeloyl-ACP methyl ester carboxylesterase